MLLKPFLPELLAIASVTALPNPGTVNHGLKVDDGDPVRLGQEI